MKSSFDLFDESRSLPPVRRVSATRIVAWLRAGWQDVKANPIPSLAYGLLFGISGDLILLASLGRPHLFTVAISGFFLVAPLLAAGLYELSRQTAAGKRPTFIDSLSILRTHSQSLAYFGLLLVMIALLWERTSAIAFTFLGQSTVLNVSQFVDQAFAGGLSAKLLLIWFALGGMLALLTFAISVVTVPLILDRNVSVANATLASLNAFASNLTTLIVWAACIVTLTLIGFATLLFGLVVIMPILGHASWHAYRDLVE